MPNPGSPKQTLLKKNLSKQHSFEVISPIKINKVEDQSKVKRKSELSPKDTREGGTPTKKKRANLTNLFENQIAHIKEPIPKNLKSTTGGASFAAPLTKPQIQPSMMTFHPRTISPKPTFFQAPDFKSIAEKKRTQIFVSNIDKISLKPVPENTNPKPQKTKSSREEKISKLNTFESNSLDSSLKFFENKRLRQSDVIRAVAKAAHTKMDKDMGDGDSTAATVDAFSYDTYFPPIADEKEFSVKADSSAENRSRPFSVHIFNINNDRLIFKKVHILRYRENVFRAASRLAKEMPPYPDWVYQDEEIKYLDITKINVGGVIFYVFDETLSMLKNTKFAQTMLAHKSDGIPFFDRDPICFNAVLNFFRTGHLHVPPNICLTMFEEELEFWGVKEQFMESCCWTDFKTFKLASNTLKKYGDDMDSETDAINYDADYSKVHVLRHQLHNILTTGQGSIWARWISLLCALCILTSIFGMLVGTTTFGRRMIVNDSLAEFNKNDMVSNFLTQTKIWTPLLYMDFAITGFFVAELLGRLLMCPSRIEFFSDSLNWIDMVATLTSLLSNIFTKDFRSGSFEGYMLILKLPRIFRLLKLTMSLRTGMEAFTLTLRASARELRLVFWILFIVSVFFGSLIFAVEMINEDPKHIVNANSISNVFIGMWWALVSMATVGFGDFYPRSIQGYIVGSITILSGLIICQLPVPIVLTNFAVYYNQAHARLAGKSKLVVRCADPEGLTNEQKLKKVGRESMKKEGAKKFARIFNAIKV